MYDSTRKYAIYCKDVSKSFYLIDETLNWKIVFRDLQQSPNHSSVLKNISLNVTKGKFVGILGRNGAGKSTLLRTLGGVYPPSSGIVQVLGSPMGLFEMGGAGSNRLTGHAYAHRYLELYGVKKAIRKILVNNILAFSELGKDFFRPIYTYSSGMLSRLYFAVATELQHDIYLVDELLSVGDAYFQSKCWKRLRERFATGASGILVTHDWAAILKLCENSYILNQGEVVAYGPSENMVKQYLNLPVPTKTYAEILTRSYNYEFESAKDSVIGFDILLKKEIPLAINYSLECFRPGYGWELILLNEEYVPMDTKLGINHCQIKLRSLPLTAGEYYLNLFIKSQDNSVDLKDLDSCSWTFGNGIKLRVTGEESKAAACLPWQINVHEWDGEYVGS